MLAGPAEHDFSLLAGSPCIDAGHPGASYNDPDGSRSDIGALPFMPPEYICGDADGSAVLNILDVTYLINFLYKSGPEPEPMAAGDADGDGGLNILDVTHLIRYLYKDGETPLCPEK